MKELFSIAKIAFWSFISHVFFVLSAVCKKASISCITKAMAEGLRLLEEKQAKEETKAKTKLSVVK